MKKSRKGQQNEEGFSLLELVMALGITMVFIAVGIVTYTSILQNFREDTVAVIAQGVLSEATEKKMNFEPSDVPEDAETEFMKDRSDTSISVTVTDSEDCLTVTATHDLGNTSTATKGDCIAE